MDAGIDDNDAPTASFLWLKEVRGERVPASVCEQNERAQAALADGPTFAAVRDR